MKNINRNIIILLSSVLFILMIYLIISLYFYNHFLINTAINGVDVSLKSYDDFDDIFRDYFVSYKLQLIEMNGESEEISGKEIGLHYNESYEISNLSNNQNLFNWIVSLMKPQKYYIYDLFDIKSDDFTNKVNELNCLNREIILPQNVAFKYLNGSYKAVGEIYGNKVNKDKLIKAIEICILKGESSLDLYKNQCYENPNPKYTLISDKTVETVNLLNKYVQSKITYKFGDQYEVIDKIIISSWISVDDNLNAIINEKEIEDYVKALAIKYDTVEKERNFKTSTGKTVKISGGTYGWKINLAAEKKALFLDIKEGIEIIKEPVYAQKAHIRNENDIGNTYVEINITKQHIWFYKNGKLITHGSVVTGNPNKGKSTVTGIYMLNYKQENATLTGETYEAKVSFWMPFYGDIGIHDAKWRYSFGGEIYKKKGSRGCVNTPLYIAKAIFDNIEEGTPIICYEE